VTAIIQLADVRKAYGTGRGKQEVLRGVSLEIEAGEMVALVGQSGSGKSTLLNIIGGLDRADQGTVIVDGQDQSKLSDGALSRLRNEKIGFVFQSFHLLDHLTVTENAMLPALFAPTENWTDAATRAKKALARVGLEEYAQRRPTELSGGQKQRVAIARSLLHHPKIMLCDEPTGNLDSETGREVIEFFKELNAEDGVTLLIVTHEERVSVAAQRVLRIVDGLMVHEGDAVAPAREAVQK
jgi:ABC-type lipoprotein export system ATPase subunit